MSETQRPTVPSSPVVVISASLRPESLSRVMASEASRLLEEAGAAVDWLDLRDVALPFCDGAAAYSAPELPGLKERLGSAAAILVAAPVYNYSLNAALKNLIEMTGKAGWEDKIVGFMAAAGGKSSYMSVMQVADSLMLDFRCLIIPRFVYATWEDVIETKITSEKIQDRVEELVRRTLYITTAFEAAGEFE